MKETGEQSSMASPIDLTLYLLLPAISSARFRCRICTYHLAVLQITMRRTWSVSATGGLNNEITGSTFSKTSFGNVRPKVSETYIFVHLQGTFFRKDFITMSHKNSKH